MPTQRFFASKDTMTWRNGAVGHRPGGPMDCLGPFAKVHNCPVDGTDRRVTAYATNYADTFFSVPAACNIRGQYVAGFFTMDEEGPTFVPMNRHRARIPELSNEE